jgi:hypothetical protein
MMAWHKKFWPFIPSDANEESLKAGFLSLSRGFSATMIPFLNPH